MSVDATRWAWMQQDITPTQKLILLALADRADENNRCWPSISRLTTDTGFDRKAIYRAIEALAAKGLLASHKDAGKPNIYTLQGVKNRESTSAQKGTSAQNGTTTSASLGTSV